MMFMSISYRWERVPGNLSILLHTIKFAKVQYSALCYDEGVPTPAQLELDNQLCFALYSASRAITRCYGPLLEASGLTYPQYLTMLVLWEAHPHPVTVGDIGGRLRLDSGTLTPLLKRLDGLGLVSRDRDPADERRVLVHLTSTGFALRRRLAAVPGNLFARLPISLDEARALMELLGRIAAVDDADG
jgi:DNA-binding MarR family transcriptional regulator